MVMTRSQSEKDPSSELLPETPIDAPDRAPTPPPPRSSSCSAGGMESFSTADDDEHHNTPTLTPMRGPVSTLNLCLDSGNHHRSNFGNDHDGNDHDADHDGIDDRYNPPCTGCASRSTPAFVFCCECGQSLCFRCDDRLHVADKFSLDPHGRPMQSHRVEHIINGGGVPLFTPVLELGALVAMASGIKPFLSMANGMLSVDYFFESVCPAVTHLRRAVFRLDHALYPILRGVLGAWCDTEDAFIKIFVDVWVRGVLTNTDSWSLLLMKTPSALAAFLVVLTVAPLLAIPYAAAATIVRGLEIHLVPCWWPFRLLTATIKLIRSIAWAPVRAATFFARCTILGLVMDADYYSVDRHRKYCLPPKTGWRRVNPNDATPYRVGILSLVAAGSSRVMRIFVHFHAVARRAIVDGILTAVFLAVAVRIVLLSTPRCGQGILSALDTFVDEGFADLMTIGPASLLNTEGWKKRGLQRLLNPHPSMQCRSIPSLLRKWAGRLGVEAPKLNELGEDAGLLTSLQDSTSDDYIDQTLRVVVRRGVQHLGGYTWWAKLFAALIVVLIIFAGALRRILYWADIQYRYRLLQHIVACNEERDLSSADDETGEETVKETLQNDMRL